MARKAMAIVEVVAEAQKGEHEGSVRRLPRFGPTMWRCGKVTISFTGERMAHWFPFRSTEGKA